MYHKICQAIQIYRAMLTGWNVYFQSWTPKGGHCKHDEPSMMWRWKSGMEKLLESGPRNRSRTPHGRQLSREEGSPWWPPIYIWSIMFMLWNTPVDQLSSVVQDLLLPAGQLEHPSSTWQQSSYQWVFTFFHTQSQTLENYLKKILTLSPGCCLIPELNPKKSTVLATKKMY